jgi:putative FmdB family regulatory protein
VPVYEYACKKCKKEFEYEQRMSDPPKKKCEKCGGALERLISMTSFQLKGSGWYKDLYSSPSPEKSESSSDAPSDAPATKAETKAESSSEKPKAAADKPEKSDKKKPAAKKPAKASSKGK